MFQFINAFQYIDGMWVSNDSILTKTIKELVEESRYNLITLRDKLNRRFLLDNSVLDIANAKTRTLGQFIGTNIEGLKAMGGDVELASSRYEDIHDATLIGVDYILKEEYPFVISKAGLFRQTGMILRGLHTRLAQLGDFSLGYLKVDLPYTTHTYEVDELTSSRLKLPKKFKLNNTLLVVGDSLIKANRIFRDDGDGFRFRDGYRKFIVDLYIDNLVKIPPAILGLSPSSIQKDELTSPEILKKLFSHPNVFFIEYTSDYPLGDGEMAVVNEFIDDYYPDLVMANNKPTNGKVIHIMNRFIVRDVIAPKNLQTYNDNKRIRLAVADEVMAIQPPTLYFVDYPIVNLK